jgi:hypothetical protein
MIRPVHLKASQPITMPGSFGGLLLTPINSFRPTVFLKRLPLEEDDVTEGPSINVDEFRHRPVNEIAAILPNKEAVRAAIEDLETANVDISTIRVLHGEKGVQILDPTGAEHGLGTQIVRWLQRLGYDRNILDVYEEALEKGESLITVPCDPADSRPLGRLMLPYGAHGIIYFGPGTAETLTSP